MREKDILFTGFRPDRNGSVWSRDPGYLVRAENVVRTTEGYRPAMVDTEAAGTPAAVAAAVLSGFGTHRSGTLHVFAGTANALYQSNDAGASWNDNSSTAYSATKWDFAVYKDQVIAVNSNGAPQMKDLNGTAVGDNFAALGGSPPRASVVEVIRDHVVLGNLFTGSPQGVNVVRWSEIGDPESWPTVGSSSALAAQSGAQELPSEFGKVTNIVGGDTFGLVFQQDAITRMTYVGGDIQYSFDTIVEGNGASTEKTAIRVGDVFYFVNASGVYRTDGVNVQNISKGRIAEAVIQDVMGFTDGDTFTTFGTGVAYSEDQNAILWTSAINLVYDKVLQFSLDTGEFSIIDLSEDMVYGSLFHARWGGSAGSSDASQVVTPFIFSDGDILHTIDDRSSISVALQTGYIELEPGFRTQVTGVQQLGSSASPTIAVKAAAQTTDIDMVRTGFTSASANRSEIQRVRSSGRFHAFRWTDTASEDDVIRGIRVFYERASRL